jgi:aconitate hydratase
MSAYLQATGRADIAKAADSVATNLRADDDATYDQTIVIDLSSLKPLINGPHSPDRAHKIGKDIGAAATANEWPLEISSALIGSCTNSSYEDISRAAAIARFAHQNGLSTKTPLLVTPGSEQVRATIERDGLLADLEQIGATVLANACGPCIGQWSRSDVEEGTENIIITSYNRNFPKRNDGLASTLAFVTSPETVVAMALSGRVDFDPTTDSLTNAAGEQVTIPVPVGVELPPKGFTAGENTFIAPPADSSKVVIKVSPTSDRLQLLEPFDAWDGNDFLNLPILMKAKGKCTTDHISAAGPWLKYRGHLENISGNMFIGAVNAFTDEVGQGKDQLDGTTKSFPDIGKSYHAAGQGWIAIGDENYGEGSSREHAAMEPRYQGCQVIFARSFARIHETNLKKQGIVPLTFEDPSVYDMIEPTDTITVRGMPPVPDQPVQCYIVKQRNNEEIPFTALHTFSKEQVQWFKAGSALNVVRQKVTKAKK